MKTTTHTGSKYETAKDMDIKDIAKLIRKDLKAAGYKASVRISRYSMGQSIGVSVTALPAGAELADAVEWVAYDDAPYTGPDSIGRSGWFRPVAMDAVEAIVKAYQDSESCSQTDYYRSNFHASVDMANELQSECTAARVAREDAKRPKLYLVEAPAAPAAKPAQVEMLESLGLL